MKKTTMLRNLLKSNELEFLMEAHNGLSSKIVEESGFKGIWASGLSISASLAVRDNNEASWTQILDVLEFMSDATSIPILMDGDTGFGNFNNARRLVKKLEQINIAGVCIEDKQFPKTNSFLYNSVDKLADPYEFAGKLMAMKDTQTDKDFVVIARIEAYNVGLSTDEAIKRANIYADHGADAILIHSNKSKPVDIDDFMSNWSRKDIPVIIVPTKYYSTPTQHFRDTGISLVIWANHNIRACITAMQSLTKKIYDEQSLLSIEDKIAPVNEVFRIQGIDELEYAEKNYLPKQGHSFNAIILAAGKNNSNEFENISRSLFKINGKTILNHQINAFANNKINDICVVCGYGSEQFDIKGIRKIVNEKYETTTELTSLAMVSEMISEEGTIICYGDLFFRKYLITELLECEEDFAIIVNPDFSEQNYNEYITATEGYEKNNYNSKIYAKKVTNKKNKDTTGIFAGIMKVKGKGAIEVKKQLNSIISSNDNRSRIIKLLDGMITKGFCPRVIYPGADSLTDINTLKDLCRAGEI